MKLSSVGLGERVTVGVVLLDRVGSEVGLNDGVRLAVGVGVSVTVGVSVAVSVSVTSTVGVTDTAAA